MEASEKYLLGTLFGRNNLKNSHYIVNEITHVQ